ncbi:MAG: prepilin-type N-terminal cleavage/methylation domain-containing protein [Verrucomicrobiota bacterium]|nr:prepilin-type N-terminal cleavage/methylation domain-containing protein [Verrucomicrobiota bacterium]
MTISRHRVHRSPRASFTLLELMVVIGIIAAMLVAVVPAVNSLSKSGGRKAAIGSLLGAVEQARANAIKTGRASYIVFPAFTSASQATLDRYHYKAFAIFEDDPASTTTPRQLKQLTNWKPLNSGVSLRAKTGVAGSVTDLPVVSSLNAAITFTVEPTATATYHCIKYNGNGEVEAPAVPTTPVMLTAFEGYVSGTAEVITSAKDAAGEPAALESLKIAHLTGRAEISP